MQLNRITYQNTLCEAIKKIYKAEEPDILLACNLAFKLTNNEFKTISHIFEGWLKKIESYSFESQIALSKVYSIRYNKNLYFDLNELNLIPLVELNWLKALLITTPEKAIHYQKDHLLLTALASVEPHSKDTLESLLSVLMKVEKKEFEKSILRLVRHGIDKSKLSYSAFCNSVLHILKSGNYNNVVGACELIKEYNFCFAECPEVPLRILIDRGGYFEFLGIETLAKWRNDNFLKEIVSGEGWNIESKIEAIKVLSFHSPKDIFSHIITLLKDYPEYGQTLIELLFIASNKGVKCSKKNLAQLLAIYFNHEVLKANDLAILISSDVEKYIDFTPFDLDFLNLKKQIELLRVIGSESSKKQLLQILIVNKYPECLELVLEALTYLNYSKAEEEILKKFELYPNLCINALKYLGGNKTITYIKDLLNINNIAKKNIPSYEKDTLELLLILSDNKMEVLEYLDRYQLPHQNEFISQLQLDEDSKMQNYLVKVLIYGSDDQIIESLIKLRQIGNYDALYFVVELLADEDTAIQEEAWDCAKLIAKRAFNKKRIWPKIVLKQQADEGINYTLALIIIKKLSKLNSSVKHQKLLGYLSQLIDSKFPLKHLFVLSESKDPHIIKFYLLCLGKSKDQKAISYIKKFLNLNQDIFTLRQAIIALSNFPKNNLEEEVSPILFHRNMNIKKAVADYLLVKGTKLSVSNMIRIIKFNDNPGLRTTVIKGLERILGNSISFFLLNEIIFCDTDKEKNSIVIALKEVCDTNFIVNIERDYPDLRKLEEIQIWKRENDTLNNLYIDPKPVIEKWKSSRREAVNFIHQKPIISKELKDTKSPFQQNINGFSIQDIIGNYFREYLKLNVDIPELSLLLDKWETILSSEDAIYLYSNSDNNQRKSFWKFLSIDKEREEEEWNNMTSYKNAVERDFLIKYFINKRGLLTALRHFIKNEKSILLIKKSLKENYKYSVQSIQDLMDLFWDYNFPNNHYGDATKAELKEWILSIEGNHLFRFKKKLLEKDTFLNRLKLVKLLSFNEQILFKNQIVKLYNICNIKQKNSLLDCIKSISYHKELTTLSFKDFLNGKKITFWQSHNLNHELRTQLQNHESAVELLAKSNYPLNEFSNDLILKVLNKETFETKGYEGFKFQFSQLSNERKWMILKPEIEKGKCYYLDLITGYKPINKNLENLLLKGTEYEQVYVVNWLLKFIKPIFFPGLENILLNFCKDWQNPIAAFTLLINLNLPEKEKKSKVSNKVLSVFANYNSETKLELLKTILSNDLPDIILDESFRKKITKSCQSVVLKSKILQLNIKASSIESYSQAEETIKLIKDLIKIDDKAGAFSFEKFKNTISEFPLGEKISLIESFYSIESLKPLVTEEIAHIFTNEILAIGLLSDNNRSYFEKDICNRIKNKNLSSEVDLKKLLKNLSEEPYEEFLNLLENILFENRYRNLENLSLRLLKKCLLKIQYLDLCHKLLNSGNTDIQRTAIRTLSFTFYKKSIPTLINLVFHKKKAISNAASNGLIHFGTSAINLLEIELPKLRPDKREVLEKIMSKINK